MQYAQLGWRGAIPAPKAFAALVASLNVTELKGFGSPISLDLQFVYQFHGVGGWDRKIFEGCEESQRSKFRTTGRLREQEAYLRSAKHTSNPQDVGDLQIRSMGSQTFRGTPA